MFYVYGLCPNCTDELAEQVVEAVEDECEERYCPKCGNHHEDKRLQQR